MELDSAATNHFESGVGIATLLKSFGTEVRGFLLTRVLGQGPGLTCLLLLLNYSFTCPQRGLPEPEWLKTLKSECNPIGKLFNWNLIIPALEPFELQIDDDTKALIVAGDTAIVAALLARMHGKLGKLKGHLHTSDHLTWRGCDVTVSC